MAPTGYTYPVRYTSVLELRTANSSTVRSATNATFTLLLAGTTTPATIYADENWTVANTSGQVTTDGDGNYTVFLDPTNDYQVNYNGASYPAFSAGEDRRESKTNLTAHAALTTGVHGAGLGDTLATQDWVSNEIAVVVPGGSPATPSATSTVEGKIKLAGDIGGTGGTSAAPIISDSLRALITGALQASQVGVASGAAALDSGGKVLSGQLPSTGTTPDATTGAKGIVQLAGDLAGTAAAPAITSSLRTLISSSVQTSALGANSGVATLDSSGKVTATQLPSGGLTGNFSNAVVSNYRENWITISGTSYTAVNSESGCVYDCTNAAGCVLSFPKLGTPGSVWSIHQGAAGQVTVQVNDTAQGSYIVEPDSHFKTRKQNSFITVHCRDNTGGSNASFFLEGDTGV